MVGDERVSMRVGCYISRACANSGVEIEMTG